MLDPMAFFCPGGAHFGKHKKHGEYHSVCLMASCGVCVVIRDRNPYISSLVW